MITKQAKLKEQAYASNLKSRALSVLIYLIDRSNQELTCFPAIPTMAEQLHISISTVKRALRELVDAGYISKDARFREKNRGQSSNLYTLIPQDEKMEGKKKECTEDGEGVEQALEKSFDNNGKGQDENDGKNVKGFGKVLGEEDVKYVDFDDMAGGEREKKVEYVVSNVLRVEEGRKEVGIKILNFQKKKFRFLLIQKNLFGIQKKFEMWNWVFLKIKKEHFDSLIDKYKVDLNRTKSKFIHIPFFVWTGEWVNLRSP